MDNKTTKQSEILFPPKILGISKTVPLKNEIGDFNLTAYLLEGGEGGKTSNYLTVGKGKLEDNLLLRLNSACLTGEVFGDDRCDCSWQLWTSLKMIHDSISGLLIYSQDDEGRGTGIFNKINSYSVMHKLNCTSAEAFQELSLPVDMRTYLGAIAILNHLKIRQVRLISNNPLKIEALRCYGIITTERLPIVCNSDEKIKDYLLNKKNEFDHFIDL